MSTEVENEWMLEAECTAKELLCRLDPEALEALIGP